MSKKRATFDVRATPAVSADSVAPSPNRYSGRWFRRQGSSQVERAGVETGTVTGRRARNLVLAGLSLVLLGADVPAASGQVPRVLGIDVSAWQGNMSQTTWNNFYTNDGLRFVFIRSSRGGTTGEDHLRGGYPSGDNTFYDYSQRYDDLYYVQNITSATSAGLFAGSYHFARPDVLASTLNSDGVTAAGVDNSGADEADHFIQMAGAFMRPGYLPPMLDLEAGSSQRSANNLAQFCVDFSTRIYQVMGIRPGVYIGGSYSVYLQGASAALVNALAKPAPNLPTNGAPSVVAPAYPTLWNARWPTPYDVQTDNPKDSYSGFYGPWDNYGVTQPWAFWQYGGTGAIEGFSSLDGDVAHGGIEYVKDLLIPALWMNDFSGDWGTLANWNCGQTPIAPIQASGQLAPTATGPLPTPRLPGDPGTDVTSGQNDTVILERPGANITVTLSSGAYNIRKLYMREALNITGGSLTINYVPSADSTTNGAQFSGPVTLTGSGSLSVHTLRVDAGQTFTLAGGTLTFNSIALTSDSTTPAKMLLSGDVNFNPLANAAATIANGGGLGSSGYLDLGGGTRTCNVGEGSAEVDVSVSVPVTNGGLWKAGAGTMALSAVNLYSGGTTILAGRLLVNNASGSGTGSGGVTVNGGTLGGTGTIAGVVTVNSGGTIAPGTASALGTLTLNGAPILGGTSLVRIDRNGGAWLADKLALTSGTLNYGGTLLVSNAGATLTGGEVFTIFSAGAYSGAFAATNLPALSSGLSWYLGDLAADGTIKVSVLSTPPLISSGPASLAVAAGQNATFTVSVLGTEPLSYQWRFNGTNVSGATSSSYTRAGVQPPDAGSYSVVVTNAYGSATSSNALLTVNFSLTATATAGGTVSKSPDQPSYSPNAVVTLTATPNSGCLFNGWSGDASGTGNPLNLTMSTNKTISASFVSTATDIILDNTNAAVTFSGIWQTGTSSTDKYGADYRYAKTAAGGLSNALYTPYITTAGYYDVAIWYPQGSNRATNAPWTVVYYGGSTNVAVNQQANGGGWRVIAPACPFAQGTSGYVMVSNDTGSASGVVMADAVRFTYIGPLPAPTINGQPQSQKINQGGTADFTVSASGTAPLYYQWRLYGTNIAGATAWEYLRANVQPADAGPYSVVVSNIAGAATSANALLTVIVPPMITTQALSQTVTLGAPATFSVGVSGTAPFGYQWRLNGTNISGATTYHYALSHTQPTNAGSYSVMVSNPAGTATSANAVLTITSAAAPHIDSIASQADGSLTLQISGGPGQFTLEVSPALSGWMQLTTLTATGSILQYFDPGPTQASRFYRLRVLP